MRLPIGTLGHVVCAATFGCLFVTTVYAVREPLLCVWLGVLAVIVYRSHHGRAGAAVRAVLVQAGVMALIVALAIAAPVKTLDALLNRRVVLPASAMTLDELNDLAEQSRTGDFPVTFSIRYATSDGARVIRWPSREMTLRDFIAGIEHEAPFRHHFGSCGNEHTILWGDDCGFGLRLEPASR